MTYNKIHDLVEAAHLITNYCLKVDCIDCIFYDEYCRLMHGSDYEEIKPYEWELPELTLKMYKEYNDTQSKLTADELREKCKFDDE